MSILSALLAYGDRAGFMLDEFLCALFGGPENTPISLVAARAKARGARWGCVMCRFLAWTVERHHCAKQLEGVATQRWAAVLAGLQLVIVAGTLGALLYWVLIPAIVRWM